MKLKSNNGEKFMDYEAAKFMMEKIQKISDFHKSLDEKFQFLTNNQLGFTDYRSFHDMIKAWVVPPLVLQVIDEGGAMQTYCSYVSIIFADYFDEIERNIKSINRRISQIEKRYRDMNQNELFSELAVLGKAFQTVCRIILSRICSCVQRTSGNRLDIKIEKTPY